MQIFKALTRGLLIAALVPAICSSAAMAQQKTASAATVKIGYFNLALVKATTTAGESEVLKNQAEAQLRRDIETGQKAIEKAREEKKSEAEIKEIIKQVQTE